MVVGPTAGGAERVTELWGLTATEAASAIAAGTLSSEALVRACLSRIEAREPEVGAWAWVDREKAIRQARERDRTRRSGVLHGVPVGIKDVFDTRDMPTQYNSPIYVDHRPGQDAAAVSLLRSSGAVILGKTETQEFGAPGRSALTRNPHNRAHSPGGSSSGSAAAVADLMVPIAIGTQTGGSLVRPASYCGVFAMKPTWNVVSREGAKGTSLTLDTVGWYGRSVADLRLVAEAMAALYQPVPDSPLARHLRVGLCRTPMWSHAERSSQNALDAAAVRLVRAGAYVEALELPAHFARLHELQGLVMAAEGRTAFMAEHRRSPCLLHDRLRGFAENRNAYTPHQICEALDFSAACRPEFDRIASRYDAVIAPSAPGEAPGSIGNQGDSVFQRMWTLLHVPCINVPGFFGSIGLPIGVTLIAGRYSDAGLLAVAESIAEAIGARVGAIGPNAST
jgi:Asp-tRNA(Asn)/Glu-tRNA(Gln) amidotransferase A subunit family amidase